MLPSFGRQNFLPFPAKPRQAGLVSVRKDGGRYRIRTYDFHRVKMALYR